MRFKTGAQGRFGCKDSLKNRKIRLKPVAPPSMIEGKDVREKSGAERALRSMNAKN